MKSWKRWLYLIAGLTAVFVAVASAAQAIREGSWAPVVSVAWLPAVVVGRLARIRPPLPAPRSHPAG